MVFFYVCYVFVILDDLYLELFVWLLVYWFILGGDCLCIWHRFAGGLISWLVAVWVCVVGWICCGFRGVVSLCLVCCYVVIVGFGFGWWRSFVVFVLCMLIWLFGWLLCWV